ncbi:MAG: hypothetical protein ACYTXI_38390 [Nostoc sp.]
MKDWVLGRSLLSPSKIAYSKLGLTFHSYDDTHAKNAKIYPTPDLIRHLVLGIGE